ncbi:MAG: hypothetical protein WBN92_17540 [Terriglobia bacterium]
MAKPAKRSIKSGLAFPNSQQSKSLRHRLVDFLEQPLFLTPVGIIGGLMGMFFYTPVLAICGICILLAFHRAKVVSGRPIFKVQFPTYVLVFVFTFTGLYVAKLLVTRKLREMNISIPELTSRIVSGVVSELSKAKNSAPDATGTVPSSSQPQKSTANDPVKVIGLVAVDVILQTDLKMEGKEESFKSHGLSIIARIVGGKDPVFVGGIDLSGKIRLPFELFDVYMGVSSLEGVKNVKRIGELYDERKPYKEISWHGWLSDSKEPIKVEPNTERFIRFTLVEATPGGGIWPRFGPLSDYVGYDDGSKKPKLTDDLPEPSAFFIGGYGHMGAYGQLPTRGIRDDFKNGNVEWRLRRGTTSQKIPLEVLHAMGRRYASKQGWEKDAVEQIYFGENGSKPYEEIQRNHK